MSKTYKPSKRRRAKKHGFLSRKKTVYGERTIERRRRKGRKRLAPTTSRS
ncbi:50S ribosomal protein L34 [Candidatus Azambacteria bacterium]|nr:50S ribosomal protein L34 [Candidatus Azambacteria bacterium]MBI3685337.1 50S ribosomal protein L34 [Candidatus Azambacteria bacterium]